MNATCREVVVTGMGVVSPFGIGVGPLWSGVSAGRSGIDWIEDLLDLDPAIYPVRYAAAVKNFCVDDHLQRHCEVRAEKSVQMGLVAAREALAQAGLLAEDSATMPSVNPVAVVVGSGHGPCHEADDGYHEYFTRGPRAVRPATLAKSMFNALSSNLSIYFGLTGANFVIASACSSGTAAIGLAAILIRDGFVDCALCGGADAPLTQAIFTGWTNMRVMARHSEPKKASRPFDAQRNGLVLGEGAAMVVLESRASAERRAAEPLAMVLGHGASSDAHHITAPTVTGQVAAMRSCLADARVESKRVDYINLHGTATRANDEAEATAVAEVFGRRGESLPASSTKSMLGHSLGASGAIEFVVCVEALRHGFVPPTINCEEPNPSVGLDYVPMVGRKHPARVAMSNSFAFGGSNACIMLGKTE
jgi:3-oxoacyl-[acyl-carrier-protein] synthase II